MFNLIAPDKERVNKINFPDCFPSGGLGCGCWTCDPLIFLLVLEPHEAVAQESLLISLSGTQCPDRGWTWVDCMQGQHLKPCSVPLTHGGLLVMVPEMFSSFWLISGSPGSRFFKEPRAGRWVIPAWSIFTELSDAPCFP